MRRLLSLLTVLSLVALLVAIPATTIFATSSTPESAVLLTPQNASVSDTLVGDHGGAAHYYSINYAGNGRPVTIKLTSQPGMNTTALAVGFKIYGPTGTIGEGAVEENADGWTRFAFTFTTTVSGTYLVQVYNYTFGIPVAYTLQATGLENATTDTTTATTSATTTTDPLGTSASNPYLIYQPTVNLGGTLVGSSAGTTQYYQVEYPGCNEQLTVRLSYEPPSPYSNNAVGFDLFRGSTLVGQGIETWRDGTSVIMNCTITQEADGPLLLKVHNYQDGLTVNYTLTITGATAQAITATTNTTSDKAIVLSSTQSTARGTLGPSNEATFHDYLIYHPGSSKTVKFRIAFDADSGITDEMIGLNVFSGADMTGHVTTHLDSTGTKRVASFDLVASDAGTYGVQVFNYSTTAAAHYTLYVIGLEN